MLFEIVIGFLVGICSAIVILDLIGIFDITNQSKHHLLNYKVNQDASKFDRPS